MDVLQIRKKTIIQQQIILKLIGTILGVSKRDILVESFQKSNFTNLWDNCNLLRLLSI